MTIPPPPTGRPAHTITATYLDQRLPHSPAGIYVGDLTDREDRDAFINWLLALMEIPTT